MENIIKNKYIDRLPLSFSCKQVLLGSILGDGKLIKGKSEYAVFYIKQNTAQQEYFYWKLSFLEEIEPEKLTLTTSFVNSNKRLVFESKALETLTLLYNYLNRNNGLGVQRRWLNYLHPLGLLIWWLDLGCLINLNRRGVLCTDSYFYSDLLLISRYFYVVHKIRVKISKHSKNNKFCYRLYFSSENIKRFLLLVAPEMSISSMIHKFKIVYKDKILQERWISELSEKLPENIKGDFLSLYRK